MRLGMVCDYFHPFTGGTEKLVLALSKGLVSRGFEVQVLSSKLRGHAKDFETLDGLHILRFPTLLTYFDKSQHLLVVDPNVVLRVRKAIKEYKLDVIHTHNILSPSAVKGAVSQHIPILVTAHDYWCIGCFRRDLLFKGEKPCSGGNYCSQCLFGIGVFDSVLGKYRRYYRDVVKKASEITTVSNATKQIMLKFGFSANRVKVIHNFVQINPRKNDQNLFRPTFARNNAQIVMYVGRMDNAKGPQILLESATQVIEEYQDVIFLFVGGRGSLLNELRTKASRTKFGNNILFLGNVSEDLLQEIYQQVDICVIPSTFPDPLPLNALEAMSAGKPAIASRTGGLPESIQDGKTGLLVQPGNAKELSKAIIYLLQNKEEAKTMGKAGQELIKKTYSEEVILDKYIEIYKKLVDG